MTYCIQCRSKGFGDYLIDSLLVHILNDNEIPTVYEYNTKFRINELADCPFSKEGEKYILYKRKREINPIDDVNIIEESIKYFKEYFGIEKDIVINRDHIPVNYVEIPEIPSVNVVLCTRSGSFAPIRNYLKFDQIKQMMDKEGITYIDLNENKILDFECLNYVKKCKLYVGVETGTSHYVSKYANNKGLIIQSGFTRFNFWAKFYKYEFIINEVECSPCGKTNKSGCRWAKCIWDIKPEYVFEEIKKRLNNG